MVLCNYRQINFEHSTLDMLLLCILPENKYGSILIQENFIVLRQMFRILNLSKH